MLSQELQNVRIMSLLSERIHYHEENGKKYACICGVILPKELASTFIIWAITGNMVYVNLLNRDEQKINELRELNSHDPDITDPLKNTTSCIIQRIKLFLVNWTPEMYDELVPVPQNI